MFHLVARAQPGTLLFRTSAEANRLWSAVAAFPGLQAACLMPDHVHLLLDHPDAARGLGGVMSAYARWRNHHRRARGPVWCAAPAPEPIPDAKHLQRTVRYVHLNPCRAGLVRDPLAWPWSTHRDAVGLAVPGCVRARRDPHGFHAYVSGDPSAAVAGTPFPEEQWGWARLVDVADAVLAVRRQEPEALRRRGPTRRLFLEAAWLLTEASTEEIAVHARASGSAVRRGVARLPGRGSRACPAEVRVVVRALGDDRFAALPPGDLRRLPGWERYRRLN